MILLFEGVLIGIIRKVLIWCFNLVIVNIIFVLDCNGVFDIVDVKINDIFVVKVEY